jgi:hypothetical protein
MNKQLLFILKFICAFVVMTAVCAMAWGKFVDGVVYDCTDPALGYLSPDGWVGGNKFPVVVVKQIVSGRSISEPDEIKEGWSVARLWCLWSSFFAGSLIVSFAVAKLPWPLGPRGRLPLGGSSP